MADRVTLKLLDREAWCVTVRGVSHKELDTNERLTHTHLNVDAFWDKNTEVVAVSLASLRLS